MWLNIVQHSTVNVLLFSSWYFLLYSKKTLFSFTDRLIGTFILGLAQIIATEMMLGLIFRKLYAAPLLWINILISLGIVSFTCIKSNERLSMIKKVISEINEKTRNGFRIIKSDTILTILFILVIIKTFWIIYIGYLFPSYTWDSLSYHLPIVGQIMQSGAIRENPVHFELDTFINIFPKNMELFFLWNTIFLKSRIITDLSQMPFVIIGMLTTYSIALKLNITRKNAMYAAVLIFFTPILLLQMNTNYIDIAISVLLLIVINFLLFDSPSYQHTPFLNSDTRTIPILLSGITAGILLGSKGSGPLFVLIFISAIIIREIIKHRKQHYILNLHDSSGIVRNSIIPYALHFILPLLLLGSYWYIKNWALYGNPVYPMEVTILNVTLFKGLFDKMRDPLPALIENSNYLIRLFHVWMERAEFYLYDSRLSGLGPIWAMIFLPSLIWTLVYSAYKKHYNWLFILILLILTFLVHPRNWTSRYTIFMVMLGALSCGYVMDYFERRDKIIRAAALILAMYTFITVNSLCVMPHMIKEFINLPVRERTIDRHQPFNIHIHVNDQYGYWNWIKNNMKDRDVLAYTFEPLFLTPLWNSGFSNKILYVTADTFNDLLYKIRNNNATYILSKQHSQADGWISQSLETVYSDDNYKIVKFAKIQDR